MRRWAVVLSALTVSLGAATTVAGTASAGSPNDPYTASDAHAQAGPMAGIVPSRDSNPGNAHGHGGGGGGTPLLSWHGGPVQHGTAVESIFWGTSWNGYTGDKISGLGTLYGGLTPSNYSGTNTEYGDPALVNASVNYLGFAPDYSAAPSHAPQTSTILNEVVKVIGPANLQNGAYYPVYIDQPRGSAGYCAWHSAGTVTYTDASGNSVTKEIQFGFFFNLDGDAGCNPNAPQSKTQSQGLLALANVTGHEYSEMVTDPQLNAWYDSSGAENADKCAWTFGSTELPIGGMSWKIQGNWSNNAYNANHGYTDANKGFVRGCIDGTNA